MIIPNFKFPCLLLFFCLIFQGLVLGKNDTIQYKHFIEKRIKIINKMSVKLSTSNKLYEAKSLKFENKFFNSYSSLNIESSKEVKRQLVAYRTFTDTKNGAMNLNQNSTTGNRDVDSLIVLLNFLENNSVVECDDELCLTIERAWVSINNYKLEKEQFNKNTKYQNFLINKCNQIVNQHPQLEKKLTSIRQVNNYYYDRNANLDSYLKADFNSIAEKFADDKSVFQSNSSALNSILNKKDNLNGVSTGSQLQINSEIKKEQTMLLSQLDNNSNVLASSMKPGFQKISFVKSKINENLKGVKYPYNPYKTKRFKDRVEKSIDLRPFLSNYFNSFSLSTSLQFEYHINLRSSAGAFLIGEYYRNSVYKKLEQKYNRQLMATGAFVNYYCIGMINLYCSYKPFVFAENELEAANNYKDNINYSKPGDVAIGLRLKPKTSKKMSNNIYLLYVISPDGNRYFDYKLGINF